MGLFSRLFGKPKPAVVDDRRPTAIVPGDLVVCVADNWRGPAGPAPKVGDVDLVTLVGDATFINFNVRQFVVQLQGYGHTSFSAYAFRKAVEDSEPAEAEFTALIKRPVRKRERV